MEIINYKGYNIEIKQQIYPEDPRVWDNLGTIVCIHRKYLLGDKLLKNNTDLNTLLGNYLIDLDIEPDNLSNIKIIEELQKNDFFIVKVYGLDHSGIRLSLKQQSNWDGGQLGFYIVTPQQMIDSFGERTEETEKKALSIINNELEDYNNYLSGDVFSYKINGITLGGGFYGNNFAKNGLLDSAFSDINTLIEKKHKLRLKKLKILIKNRVPLELREDILKNI